jgi:hypothetical protein
VAQSSADPSGARSLALEEPYSYFEDESEHYGWSQFRRRTTDEQPLGVTDSASPRNESGHSYTRLIAQTGERKR